MRIRTVSLTTAAVVLVMLAVGTWGIASLTGGTDRSAADNLTARATPTPSVAAPSPSALPSATDDEEDKASDAQDDADDVPAAEGGTAGSPSPSASAQRRSEPSPSASAERNGSRPTRPSAEPSPSPSPVLLDYVLDPIFGG